MNAELPTEPQEFAEIEGIMVPIHLLRLVYETVLTPSEVAAIGSLFDSYEDYVIALGTLFQDDQDSRLNLAKDRWEEHRYLDSQRSLISDLGIN
ncbi:hypothetical protein H0X09_03675 [Candidatus Saccharibacteria bacterium]|nr:hypothetical protein [Candidatus Saccharibacteria bacterium]